MAIVITEHDNWADELLSTFKLDHLVGKEVAIVIEEKEKVSDVDDITIYPKDKRRKPITLHRTKPSRPLYLEDYQHVIFDVFVDVVMMAKRIQDARHSEQG